MRKYIYNGNLIYDFVLLLLALQKKYILEAVNQYKIWIYNNIGNFLCHLSIVQVQLEPSIDIDGCHSISCFNRNKHPSTRGTLSPNVLFSPNCSLTLDITKVYKELLKENYFLIKAWNIFHLRAICTYIINIY